MEVYWRHANKEYMVTSTIDKQDSVAQTMATRDGKKATQGTSVL